MGLLRVGACAVVPAVFLLLTVGCGAGGDERGDAVARTGAPPELVDACTERLLAHGEVGEGEETMLRDYLERTYCSRFAERGWVNEDGTLDIAAQEWAEESGDEECARVTGAGAETVPCEELPADPLLDCALLHHVRRSEVRTYVEELRRERGDVECDDGTPLERLGVP